MIAPHNGFFVEYGYTYKPVGSGNAFCGGFRHDLFDRRARVELEAGISFRNYHMLRADFALPRLANDRLETRHRGSLPEVTPQEDFYGAGIDSAQEIGSSFLFKGIAVPGPRGRQPEAVAALRHRGSAS